MPWSPLRYTDEIFSHLRKMGHTDKTTTEYLHIAIMKETMLIKSKTIGNVIKAFEKLGYIVKTPEGVWDIKYWEKKAMGTGT